MTVVRPSRPADSVVDPRFRYVRRIEVRFRDLDAELAIPVLGVEQDERRTDLCHHRSQIGLRPGRWNRRHGGRRRASRLRAKIRRDSRQKERGEGKLPQSRRFRNHSDC